MASKAQKVKMEDLNHVLSNMQIEGRQFGMPFNSTIWTIRRALLR